MPRFQGFGCLERWLAILALQGFGYEARLSLERNSSGDPNVA